MSNFTDLADHRVAQPKASPGSGGTPPWPIRRPGTSTALADHTIGYESDEDLDNGYRPAGSDPAVDDHRADAAVPQDYGERLGRRPARRRITSPCTGRQRGAGFQRRHRSSGRGGWTRVTTAPQRAGRPPDAAGDRQHPGRHGRTQRPRSPPTWSRRPSPPTPPRRPLSSRRRRPNTTHLRRLAGDCHRHRDRCRRAGRGRRSLRRRRRHMAPRDRNVLVQLLGRAGRHRHPGHPGARHRRFGEHPVADHGSSPSSPTARARSSAQ